MAFGFIGAAHYDNSSSNSAVVSKPTGTTDNDIMFCLTKHNTNEAVNSAPSGWAHLGSSPWIGGAQLFELWWKLASSEGSNYTWGWATASRTSVTILTYRDGFDTADPIDVVSNTGYSSSNTVLRAASMTVSAANSPLIFIGVTGLGSTISATPPTVPTTFVEDLDYWADGGRMGRHIASVVWTGSGATNDMDATIDTTMGTKHAFAVALNPGSAPVGPSDLTLSVDSSTPGQKIYMSWQT